MTIEFPKWSSASKVWFPLLWKAKLTQEKENLICCGIFYPQKEGDQLLRLEKARSIVIQSESIEAKMRKAVKAGTIPKAKGIKLYESAKAANIISDQEFNLLKEVDIVRLDAVTVDDFSEQEYQNKIP